MSRNRDPRAVPPDLGPTHPRTMLRGAKGARAPLPGQVPPGRKPQPPFIEFGRYLKSCRERAGFPSQRAALRAPDRRGIQISQALLAHYESGRVRDPSPLVLSGLASLYRRGLHEILLRLAHAKFRSVRAEESPLDRARWELVESGIARTAAIGTAPDLEIDRLRALASFQREVEILDVAGIARWQRSMESLGTMWVIAPSFPDDEADGVLEAVAHNLRRGVRYTYFISAESEARFESLRSELQERVGEVRDVAGAARPVFLPSAALPWLHADYLIANPDRRAEAIGFQKLRSLGKTRFAFRLAPPDLLELVDRLSAWMTSSRKEP